LTLYIKLKLNDACGFSKTDLEEGIMRSIIFKIAVCISVFFICLSVPAVRGSDDEIEVIRRAIVDSGADWVADDNWIMQLPPEERKLLLGGMPELSGELMSPDEIPFSQNAMLSNFTWTNYNGYNWMTSVKQQGSCGSCAAFGAAGAVEGVVRVVKNDPFFSIDLSEQHLFSCGGGSCSTGWYLGSALDYFVTSGVPDENCLPYSGVDNNCSSTCSDWSSRALHINGWNWVTNENEDVNAVKSAIAQGPVPCRMEVYTDFYSYSGGIYSYTSGNLEGGHFVVLVGWDDAYDCWIVKNSWDSSWGENGYFRIKRGETKIATWSAHINYTSQSPTTATVSILMPSTHYYSGDTCYCNVKVENSQAISGHPLFVVLNVYGSYFFAPSFSPFLDYYNQYFSPPSTTVQVLPSFSWPYSAGNASNIHFYSCVTNPGISQLVSNLADFSFGWTSSDPTTGAAIPVAPGFEKGIFQSFGD